MYRQVYCFTDSVSFDHFFRLLHLSSFGFMVKRRRILFRKSFSSSAPHGYYWFVSSNNTQYGKQCTTTPKIKRRETKFFQDRWHSFKRKKGSGDNIWQQNKTSFLPFFSLKNRLLELLFQAFNLKVTQNTFESFWSKSTLLEFFLDRISLNHTYSHVKVCLGM